MYEFHLTITYYKARYKVVEIEILPILLIFLSIPIIIRHLVV